MAVENAVERATALAGNWRKWESFSWHGRRQLADAAQWAIVYTSNRDSTLLEQSNAAAVAKLMEPFTEGDDPDAVAESHGHWACGHVDGYAIRCLRDGAPTPAVLAWLEIEDRLEDYPVLDESDYGEREYEATLENIKDAARWNGPAPRTLPEGWESDVYSWLSDNDQRAVENRDDQGGYPDKDQLEAAFDALGYPLDAD